jgi:ParB family chromosome partitioning protein
MTDDDDAGTPARRPKQRSGLGRGLSALLSEPAAPPSGGATGPAPTDLPGAGAAVPTGSAARFREVPPGRIRPNPRQPRDVFDDGAIEVLADSVRRIGVLQPLVVRDLGDGEFELIAGERRLRASRRAGLATVPVFVRDASDEESLEQALLENLHRQDLNALEEAAAFQQLIDDFSLTHEAVADRVGRSRASVSNTLRLLALPGEVQEMVHNGAISGGHARALLAVPDPQRQVQLARAVVAEGWSVRRTEQAVRAAVDGTDGGGAGDGRTRRRTSTPPSLLEVGGLMGEFLDTTVNVTMGRRKGSMVIEFGSLEDLDRITQLILGTGGTGTAAASHPGRP